MTIREFKKLKINDIIYWCSNDGEAKLKGKITSIDSNGFYVKQDFYTEYISKQDCEYYYKDKNKCISENIKRQINDLMTDISNAEYEIKNLDKYIKDSYNKIEKIRNKYSKFIEENVEEFI